MELVVLTGMSGAGKASAAKIFEDMGYLVVDNLPPILLPELVEKCVRAGEQAPGQRLAVVADARAGTFFAGLEPALELVNAEGVSPVILFLDASDEMLLRRFKETRRAHPLFDEAGGILGSIRAERALLESIRESADRVIDTTDLNLPALRTMLVADFNSAAESSYSLTVTIISFGFKFGLPLDADLVFDVRFLINPYYVSDLRPLDGRNQSVEEYVMRDPDSGLFLGKLYDLMGWSIPQYVEEGKAYLTVAIGCTGGRHRSVMVAEKLGNYLRGQGYRILVQHRDLGK